MEPGAEPFKIIIAGGGVAGLSLAVMLEKVGIDYVLLEAHESIAPVMGASIGMQPNGLRILDQMGCAEPLKGLGDPSPGVFRLRDNRGEPILKVPGFWAHTGIRCGFQTVFFDRELLIQTLHNVLHSKEKVRAGERISRVNHNADSVEAVTDKGHTFRGTMIVGADGVHSIVRREMHRIGHRLQPGYFPPDEESRVACYNLCSFGIARDVPGWVDGDVGGVAGDGVAQIYASGPEGRVYWFFFSRLPKAVYGKDIPRCTKEMEAEFVQKHGQVPVTTRVTFRQLFDRRVYSTLTAVHEHIFQKWFFKRMGTIGDSAHKSNPITGHGGNAAIESAAELVNALTRAKRRRSGDLTGLSAEEAHRIFAEMQAARYSRARQLVWMGSIAQSLFTSERPWLSKLVFRWVAPARGPDEVLGGFLGIVPGAARVDELPVRDVARFIPFDDELPARPLGSATAILARALFAVLMILHLGVSVSTPLTDEPPTKFLHDFGKVSVALTGIPPVDVVLRILVSAFSFVILSEDPNTRLQVMYFISQLASPVLIYTIEGYRLGNQGSPLALTSLFLGAMQLLGAWTVTPLYALLHAFMSFGLPTGRCIPLEVSKALLPALVIGFMIPTIMMFVPNIDSESRQAWIGIWQLSPVLAVLLTRILARCLRKPERGGISSSSSSPEKPQEDDSDDKIQLYQYQGLDMPGLANAYSLAALAQATVHIAILAYIYRYHHHHHDPQEVSIFDTFFNVPSLFERDWHLSDGRTYFSVFFKWDLLVATSAWASSQLFAVWELRACGYVTTRKALAAGLAVAAGHVLAGPGATWAGLWYWRERVFSRLGRYAET